MKKHKVLIFCLMCFLVLGIGMRTTVEARDKTESEIQEIVHNDEVSLYSQYAIVINVNDNRILYEKAARERMYPASMTKIMTTLVALEAISDLDEKVVITEEMWEGLREANASTAGFKVG